MGRGCLAPQPLEALQRVSEEGTWPGALWQDVKAEGHPVGEEVVTEGHGDLQSNEKGQRGPNFPSQSLGKMGTSGSLYPLPSNLSTPWLAPTRPGPSQSRRLCPW